jgi:hypothetical protein
MTSWRGDELFAPLVPPAEQGHYLESAEHYRAVARRAVAAIRSGKGPFVLLCSDPPANPEALVEALGKVAGPGQTAIAISCRPPLLHEDLDLRVLARMPSAAIGSLSPEVGWLSPTPPLLVLDLFDRLSDRQIEEIFCKPELERDQLRPAILLCSSEFSDRLEFPALRPLKESICARLHFGEVGSDETVAFLHNRLLAQRDRRVEARGFRRGILIGLVASGITIAATGGVMFLPAAIEEILRAHISAAPPAPLPEQPRRPRSAEQAPPDADALQADINAEIALLVSREPPSTSPPMPPKKPQAELTPALPSSSPPSGSPGHPRVVTQPAIANIVPERGGEGKAGAATPRLSDPEIAALVARGDWFLSAGDITSARPFYQRAAQSDSGPAAFRLGATFDPAVQRRIVVNGTAADPAAALFWYRRAQALGVRAAERRIRALAAAPVVKKTVSH